MIKDSDIIWLNDASKAFLNSQSGYLLEGESVSDRINNIAKELEKALNKKGFAQKFSENLAKGWYAPSTPFWSNVGRDNGLPFSCFNTDIQDNLGSIFLAEAEIGMMTKLGGGTSAYMGNIRGEGAAISNSSKPSGGSLAFARGLELQIQKINQGVRRGYIACYWDATHKDIMKVLDIQREGHPIQDMNYGVCISDDFLKQAKEGNAEYRETLLKIHESRFLTGLPYIFFSDNVNNAKPDVYKEHGFEIKSSNLCAEIVEVSNKKYSFLCDLAAMNLTKYDEWKDDKEAVEILIYALDALHTIFQEKLESWRDSGDDELELRFKFMERAYNASKDFRDVGLGVIGWHSLLKDKMIAFESFEAKMLNVEVAKHLQLKAREASEKLAKEYGEPTLLKGYGRRNCLLNAIAPTTSAAFILGQVSQQYEPNFSNYYIKDVAQSKFVVKDEALERLLESLGKNTEDIWISIRKNDGSIQHLDFLSAHEKNVFKTFSEISPMEIIIQASQRQKYIDQSQSLNLMIGTHVTIKEINALFYEAHRLGIKTLYYQHGVNQAQQFRKNLMSCISCES